MPKLTVNGKELEVPVGTNLIEAARAAGVEVPHYCYHPGLSIAGQCRLCMVDIEKTPRPTIARVSFAPRRWRSRRGKGWRLWGSRRSFHHRNRRLFFVRTVYRPD